MLRHRCGQEALWGRHRAWFFVVLAALSAASASSASADDTEQIARGRKLFMHVWHPNDPECHGGDGLGPRYNERSCAACHRQHGVGGGGPLNKNVQSVDFGKLPSSSHNIGTERAQMEYIFPGVKKFPFVLHRFGADPSYAGWFQVESPQVRFVTIQGYYPVTVPIVAPVQVTSRFEDLERRGFSQTQTSVGPNLVITRHTGPEDLVPLLLSERNTTALFGAGVIDTIPAEVIEATIAKQPREVRGRLSLLPDGKMGRFGWQAQVASLADFNAMACAVELGLDNPSHRQTSTTLEPTPAGEPLDLTQQDCDAIHAFVASLPPPYRSEAERNRHEVVVGERVFNYCGCAECHVRDLGPAKEIYSDLLLHQMGSGQKQITPATRDEPLHSQEWRTPPLWGCADSAPYMNNGSAATLTAAILEHHGQGYASSNAFRRLRTEEKHHLLAFLQSLRAPHTADKSFQDLEQPQTPKSPAAE
jgi:CxxC motif-containing protein (DUF1111 family)